MIRPGWLVLDGEVTPYRLVEDPLQAALRKRRALEVPPRPDPTRKSTTLIRADGSQAFHTHALQHIFVVPEVGLRAHQHYRDIWLV